LALPTTALAQSTIAGTVKDMSGGVLPGVTVEVSSPALIEGTKAATTDSGGVYRIVDLRPGMYTVKFTLSGFATVERAAFQLLSDFNARIDAEMKVGALAETITVTGAAPIVDVSSASHVAVLDREAIDNVPTAKTIQGLGQLILGVSLSAPDVGGTAGAMQTYMSLRGGSVGAANNTVMVDGMVINGFMANGAVQTYTNDADFQEMTYQTAGIGAERSAGGVTLNLVPKEGGNNFSGTANAAYRPGGLQGDNYSERFKTWGLVRDKNGDPAINRVKRISDVTGSEGGPIKKDRLWFFVSGRDFQPINTVPDTFLDDGTQGVDDNYIRNAMVRLTYQASPRHKFGAYYEKVFKWRGHDMAAKSDPETTGVVWRSPNYSTMSAKYTGTLSSKLLVEGGFAQNAEYYRTKYQENDAASNIATYGNLCCGSGIGKDPLSEAWYAYAAHTTIGGGGSGVSAGAPISYTQFPLSQVYQGSASYVTGSHHAKLGFSLKKGHFVQTGDSNAELSQNYPVSNRDPNANYNVVFPTNRLSDADFAKNFPTLTARPCAQGAANVGTTTSASTCTVSLTNQPLVYSTTLNHDFGVYIQDSFTMKRLTINAGIRYETLVAQVDASNDVAGRFVPVRVTQVRPDIPNWKDWAPRFQLVYDLFGDSKTAIKYSINRYNEAQTTGLAEAAQPLIFSGFAGLQNNRQWTDLNNDDIAQGQRNFNADGTANDCIYLTVGCEINLSGSATQAAFDPFFGTALSGAQYTNFPRRYRLEQGIEVQHALLPRLSINGTYYHGVNKNLTKTVSMARTENVEITGAPGTGQYRAVQLYNPVDGTPYTYYAQIPTAFPTSTNVIYVEPKIKSEYDSYTAEMRMRPYAGAQLTGGIEFARTLTRDCESSYVKPDGTTAIVDPNSLRFCDQWNMVAYPGGPTVGKPFTKNFKLSGAMPLVYGLNLGVSYQNIDSGGISPTFLYGVGATQKYPDGTQKMLGNSTVVPACPTTFGCVPGSQAWVTGVGTVPLTALGSQFAPGAIADERIVQLDIKLSKNFRVRQFSIQPTFEAFNVANIDQVRNRVSSQYAATSGNYLQPSNMLPGRIIGFGANLKW